MMASINRILDNPNDYRDGAALEYMSVTLRHLQQMDSKLGRDTEFCGQTLIGALCEIAEVLRPLSYTEEVSFPRLRRLSDYLRLHFSTSKNGCLDLVAKLVCELGMGTTLQHMDISKYGDQSSPLLYHAIERPLLSSLFFDIDSSSSSNVIISELVANGCDVNKVFIEQFCGVETTPWIHWLDQSPPDDYYLVLKDSWVAEELLSAGADVSGAEHWFKTPITILVGRRILGDSLEEDNIDDEDGGFNGSHPFFDKDLIKKGELRLAYERVRRLLRDSARQRREKVGGDSVTTVSPRGGRDEGNMLKRRHRESIQDDEYACSSASGSLQIKRPRTSAPLDTEMEIQELA